MPTFSVKNSGFPAEQLLLLHRFWHRNNFPATAACCNQVSGGIDGLITGHAYTFLDIQDLSDDSGNVVHTIAKVRNPWGKEKYTGDFRDDDDVWTDAWKEQVKLKVADDGIFWMPYSTFLTYFRKADVAYYHDYKHDIHKYKPSERQTRLVVNNPVSQKLYITGEMYSERHYPRAKKCQPNNNVVLYFMNTDHSAVNSFAPYEFISWWGFGTVGKAHGPLPKG